MDRVLYKQIVQDLPIGYLGLRIVPGNNDDNPDCVATECNAALEEIIGRRKSEVEGMNIYQIFPELLKSGIDCKALYTCFTEKDSAKKQAEYVLDLVGKRVRLVISCLQPLTVAILFFVLPEVSAEGQRVAPQQCADENLRMQKRLMQNYAHNEELIQLMSSKMDSMQEILDLALDKAIRFTESRDGYLFFYDEPTEKFTLFAWKLGSACAIPKREIEYHLKDTGFWGEVIRQRKPIVDNDFSAQSPLKKGFPQGHVALKNYLSIPVFDNNKIVAAVGVANKDGDYDDDDILSLYLLMNNVWSMVERKRSDELLRAEKDLFKTTLLSVGDGILATDEMGRITVMNGVAQQLTGWKQEDALGRHYSEVFCAKNINHHHENKDLISRIISQGKEADLSGETILTSKDGMRRAIANSSAPIIGPQGKASGVVIAFRDVTIENEKVEAIEYFIHHDQLTNLYNRTFFEEEMRRLDTSRNLPLAIIMADVNGLKLTNDAFGHGVGDRLLQKAAVVIKSCCRADDIVARIGGDEFVMLMPRTSNDDAERIVGRIREKCSKTYVDSVMLSISFGWESKTETSQDIGDIQKKAEDRMYRRKLFESPSMRGKMVDAITQTLYEVNKNERDHAQRVGELCEAFAVELGLDEREIKNIKTAGLLHDIGKIAVDSHILNKKGPLTDEEWFEIKRHPEIGYRILSSVNGLSDIADCILSHHEYYDGTGYPKKLKGKAIPVEARIIAIVNAFDAMTNPLPYRAPVTQEQALSEIARCAGTQFDPRLASIFIEKYPAWSK